MEEISYGLHTITARSEWRENKVETSGQESNRPGEENENEEPNDGPTPLKTHCVYSFKIEREG